MRDTGSAAATRTDATGDVEHIEDDDGGSDSSSTTSSRASTPDGADEPKEIVEADDAALAAALQAQETRQCVRGRRLLLLSLIHI